MSENKHEIPREDRKKVSKLYPTIPEAKGYESKQQSYDVGYGSSERKNNVGYGDPHFNVASCHLKRRGEKRE